MASGKRKNQKESPEEELDRLLDELELTRCMQNHGAFVPAVAGVS